MAQIIPQNEICQGKKAFHPPKSKIFHLIFHPERKKTKKNEFLYKKNALFSFCLFSSEFF